MGAVANSPEGQARIAAFQQGLQQLGWTEGRKCTQRDPLARRRQCR